MSLKKSGQRITGSCGRLRITQWACSTWVLLHFYFSQKSLAILLKTSIKPSGISLAQYSLCMVHGAFIAAIGKTIFMNKALAFFLFSAVLISCGNRSNKQAKASKADTVRISVDESFQPIIAEEIKVFQSAYPQTTVYVSYKPEAACLRDLDNDSVRVIIISRELNRTETSTLDNSLGYKPEFAELAKDAVVVIANNANKDSTFTLAEIKQLLNGTSTKDLKVAVDGNSATSTVRYLKDTLLQGGSFSPNVSGAKNTDSLIGYISETPNSIGFAGISWITNPQSAVAEQQLKNVKICMLECKTCKSDIYAKPSQQTITFNQYPLVRRLYYVLKENYPGVASRFINFLSTERGQLIFRRALLVPSKMQFNRRITNIQEAK